MSNQAPILPSPTSSSPSERKAQLAGSLFETLDSDGDGFIVANDLAEFIEDRTKLSEILLALDPDQSGKISRQKFIQSFDLFMDDEDEEVSQTGSEDPAISTIESIAEEEDKVKELESPTTSTTSAVSNVDSTTSTTQPIKRKVSFGDTAPPVRTIPPAASGIQPIQVKARSGLPTSGGTLKPGKKLLLKKGYASLKHSLILDELRHSPYAISPESSQTAESKSSPSANATTPMTPTATPAQPAPKVASIAPSPASPTLAATPAPTLAASSASSIPPRRHVRQASSTDYSFQYSKSHSSLLERTHKILAWCEDTDAQQQGNTDAPNVAATITFAEIETTIHYLARSFTPNEQSMLLELFQLHNITAVPVQLFRDVIRSCVDREQAQKAALLPAKSSPLSPGSSSSKGSPRLTSTSGHLSVTLSPLSPVTPNAAFEFNPDSFVTYFLDTIQRKIEVMDVKLLQPLNNPNVLSAIKSSNNSTNGANDSDGIIMNLRTQLRQSEAERLHQKQRYDFNLIFTKRLEAENWQLRETIEAMKAEKMRQDECVDEYKSGLDAHKALVAGLERTVAQLQQQFDRQKEEYENLRVMCELERKSRSKLAFENEKLQTSLHQISQVRSGSNKSYFRDGLEEMQKSLGNLRYQRSLQLEVARVGVIESEKQEALAQLRQAEQTLAEQQRILNEIQGNQLGKLGVRGSMVGIGHELRGPTTQPIAPVKEESESLGEELGEETAKVDASDLAQRLASTEAALRQVQQTLMMKDSELTSLRSSSAAKITELQQQLDELNHSHSSQDEKYQSDVAALQRTLEAHQAELAELKASHQTTLEAHKSELAKLRATHQTELDSHSNELAQLRAAHQLALDKLTASQKQELADARAQCQQDYENQLNLIKKQHTTTLDELSSSSTKKIQMLEERIADLERQLAAQRETDLQLLQQREKELKDQLQAEQLKSKKMIEQLQADLIALRTTLSSTQTSLAMSQQAQKDHVCSVSTSVNEAMAQTQESLRKEQAFRRESEKNLGTLATTLTTLRAQLGTLGKKKEEQEAEWKAKLENEKKIAEELRQTLSTIQGNCKTLAAQNTELSTLLQTLQQQYRTAKADVDDLHLQLSTNHTQTQAIQKDFETQIAHLNGLVQTWKVEAEKLRTNMDGIKREHSTLVQSLEEKLKELERRNKELEAQIKNHVCVGGGNITFQSASTPIAPASSPMMATSSSSGLTLSVELSPISGGPLSAQPGVGYLSTKPDSGAIATSSNLPLTTSQLLELHSYGTFVTQALGDDPDLKHVFPLDLKSPDSIVVPVPVDSNGTSDFSGFGLDLLTKFKDGLLLAKLINFVAPHTIDERVLNKRVDGGSSLGWKSIVENLNVCITSAKSLGLTMRVPTQQETDMDLQQPGAFMSNDQPSKSSVSDDTDSISSSASPANYVGIQLDSAQIILMSANSTLENVDILLDFLFQLLKTRLVTALFGPEKRKLDRLQSMVSMPKLTADLKNKMMMATQSLQPTSDSNTAAVSSNVSPKPNAKATLRMSKYATLSKSSQPSNLSSADHKRFVTYFTTTILKDFDSTSEFSALTPEQLLLRWLNWNIMQHAINLTNAKQFVNCHFIAHLSDLDIPTYRLLLAQIDFWRLQKGVITDASKCYHMNSQEEAAKPANILAYLSNSLQIHHFHSPAALATNQQRLNLLLSALIFQQWPMMDEVNPDVKVTGGSAIANKPLNGISSVTITPMGRAAGAGHVSSLSIHDGMTDDERESTLLTSFLNSSGIPHIHVNNLFTDIRTGLILLRFLDYLEPGCVDWKMVELNPTIKLKCISNLNLFLSQAHTVLKLQFVNVGAVDLYSDKNSKFVLAVMWQLLRYQTIAKLKEIRQQIQEESGLVLASPTADISDASILEWANSKVAERIHPILQSNGATSMTSFQDPGLKSSFFLLNLLDNLRPGSVDWKQVEVVSKDGPAATPSSTQALYLRNASLTISIARKLGAELFALPQDIVNANKKVILLIVASLMTVDGAEQ